MAAIAFPYNDIWLIQVNLPKVFPVLTLNYASFLIPYFNLLFYLPACEARREVANVFGRK